MIPRVLLGTAQVPGGEKLELFSHGRDFMIVLQRNELMSTRLRGSEEALATMAIERLGTRKPLRLLIGGYGMGFTLRAALANLGPKAHVMVAELVPEIIEWARGPMAEVAAGCLEDPRVLLRLGDVGNLIELAEGEFDAILLDVDNGPDGLVREDNNRLYTKAGLRAAKRALTSGGILAIWSAGPDPRFRGHLERTGFAVDEVKVSARGNGKGAKHIIWFARKA